MFPVGIDRLPLVPEYLNLGSVVVIAPDRDTLQIWTSEQATESPLTPSPNETDTGTVVDLAGRRIICDGGTLPLSDLEFRVLSVLLSPPGRAISFHDLKEAGWGADLELATDRYTVRALIQRLRAKLEVPNADLRIEAVHGYGFRAVSRSRPFSRVHFETAAELRA